MNNDWVSKLLTAISHYDSIFQDNPSILFSITVIYSKFFCTYSYLRESWHLLLYISPHTDVMLVQWLSMHSIISLYIDQLMYIEFLFFYSQIGTYTYIFIFSPHSSTVFRVDWTRLLTDLCVHFDLSYMHINK